MKQPSVFSRLSQELTGSVSKMVDGVVSHLVASPGNASGKTAMHAPSSHLSIRPNESFPTHQGQARVGLGQSIVSLFLGDSRPGKPTGAIGLGGLARHKQNGRQSQREKLLTPEEDVKTLINTATRLDDVWEFFCGRLQHGHGVDLLCFSIVDDSDDFIRIPYLYPLKTTGEPFNPLYLSMTDETNHIIQSYCRQDTTFTPSLSSLGPGVLDSLAPIALPAESSHSRFNLFSVPFIAGNRTIALLTLGFTEIDTFSQAKLSYVYTLREQIAQLVWNLILQERMSHQAYMDNLTGLMSHGSFQRVFDTELEKALNHKVPLTLMLLDINNLHDINQQFGHQVGDQAIQYLASSVRRSIRGLDTVARYGGDEVVVLLPEIERHQADEVASRFIRNFQGFRERLGKSIPPELVAMSVSVGYSCFPHDTHERDDLLKKAEQALHLAKFRGSKTGESTRIASCEVDKLNEKTILEVFASYVARKYNHQPSGLFNTLIRHAEIDPAEMLQSLEDKTEHLKLETIRSLAGALEAKDRYTRGHSQAVSNYAVALAHAMKLPPEQVEQIRVAGFLHDIGKIGIPESILCKPGPLDGQEIEIMKEHPVIGARQILAPVSSLKPIIPMVEHHHEQWDGGGHPAGLSGTDIPLGARIISVVDAFHALTSDRPYRSAMTIVAARRILLEGAGTKWDPKIVEIFFKLLDYASPKARSAVKKAVGTGQSVLPATPTDIHFPITAGHDIPLRPRSVLPADGVDGEVPQYPDPRQVRRHELQQAMRPVLEELAMVSQETEPAMVPEEPSLSVQTADRAERSVVKPVGTIAAAERWPRKKAVTLPNTLAQSSHLPIEEHPLDIRD